VTRLVLSWCGLILGSWAFGASTPARSAPDVRGPSAQWAPPLGIPAPSFGVSEQGGPATYFVDNSSPEATDDGNAQGSPKRPRRTVPSTLPAGSVVEVRGGPYAARQLRWTASGAEGRPVFVRGVGSPVFTGAELRVEGAFLVIEGIVLEGMPLRIGLGHHFCVRRTEIRGYNPGHNGAAVAMAATDVVLLENHIHHNGNPSATSEEDVHGIKPDTGSSRLWIVDNHIHHNGGDAIQVGSSRSTEPWAEHIYIGRNELHHDRENAVDVKRARDVVISENRIYSYAPTTSSSGEAVVVHDGPERVWLVNNEIRDAGIGVACTGATGFYVVGNVIHRIHHPPGLRYDPNSLYGPHAILVYGSAELHAVSNTVFDVDAGISVPNGGNAVIVNNIIAGLAQGSRAIVVGGRTAQGSTSSPNLVGEAGTLFRDPAAGDFRLRAGAPAIDVGVVPEVYAIFKKMYGLDIARDRASTPRPQGRAFDMGALEYLPATAAR